jgi:hypothetical protein
MKTIIENVVFQVKTTKSIIEAKVKRIDNFKF